MTITKLPQAKLSEQNVLNTSYDSDYDVLVVEPVGFDGQALQRLKAQNLQIKRVNDGTYDYFCFSAPGTAVATAKWQVFRLDSSANLMYADADANFDNIASDPTLLDYKYA